MCKHYSQLCARGHRDSLAVRTSAIYNIYMYIYLYTTRRARVWVVVRLWVGCVCRCVRARNRDGARQLKFENESFVCVRTRASHESARVLCARVYVFSSHASIRVATTLRFVRARFVNEWTAARSRQRAEASGEIKGESLRTHIHLTQTPRSAPPP